MTDKSNNHLADPSISEPNEESGEPQHHFGADLQVGGKKTQRRGSFSSSFSPRAVVLPPSPKTKEAPSEPSEAEASPVETERTDQTEQVEQVEQTEPEVVAAVDPVFESQRLFLLLATMLPLGLFAFWPSFKLMSREWYYNLDYGHGFFVIPLIAVFLYLRLDTYPGTQRRLAWIGLAPILLSCGMRFYAVSQYFDAIDQWAILFWTLGVVWLFYGNRVFYWACPSLLFMIFMFPLPFRFEVLLRNRLQEFAAKFAAMLLTLLGETAVPIKNTIRMSTMELDVAAACSGIRFLVSIMAIAFAAILLMRRPWWQNLCVFLLAPPLALFVNAVRIAMTGILLTHFSDLVRWYAPKANNISVVADEISGIVMIFVAFGMFFALTWFLGKVFQRVEI